MSINQNFPEVSPSLLLDFANSRTLDPRITFERSSIGTYVASNGLIKTAAADEPRFDHDPETGESLGLLIEESRTNLFDYSVDFSQNWAKSRTSVTLNTTTSPDGTNTASTLSVTSGPSYAYMLESKDTNNGIVYSVSFWVKYNNCQYVWLLGAERPDAFAYFDVLNGVVGASNGYTCSMTPYPNGWYRITATKTKVGDTGNEEIGIGITRSLSPTNNQIGDSVYIWGAQFEQGAFPTSYIPTSGSTVTREPDNASITGTNFSDWYKIGDGSWYTEARGGKSKGSNAGRIISLSGGGAPSSSAVISTKASDSNGWNSYDGINNPTIQDGQEHYTAFGKCAVGYDASTLSIASDPSLTSNSTSLHGSRSYTGAIIGAFTNATTEHLNGHIKKLSYYPQRLTDSQLQNLTK